MKQFIVILSLFFFSNPLESMVEEYDSLLQPCAFVETLVHAGPSMTPAELKGFAIKNNVVLSPDTFAFQKTFRYADFDLFQKGYDAIFSVLKADEDMEKILLDYARRSAQEGRKYLEFMICPSRIKQSTPTLNWQSVLKVTNSAAKKAEEKYGIVVTPLMTLLRGDSQEQCEEYTRFLIEHSKRDLDCFGGLQLAGDEQRFSSVEPYRNCYDMVHKAGLGCAAHAGESGGPENILEALSLPGVSRISHALSCIKNQGCIDAIKEKGALVDLAISSNICMETQKITTFQEHPLPDIFSTRIECHFTNGDNPLLYNTSAGTEARIVRDNFDLPLIAFMQSDISAMNRAFLPPSREFHRRKIIAAIQAYYEKEKEEPSQPKQKGWGSWNFLK